MGDTIKARKGIKASIDPLLLGEFGFTTDEERVYIGGNNGNIPLPNAADLSEMVQVATLTLINGWTNYGGGYQTVKCVKVGKTVHLSGVIKSGTGAIGYLPIGFRPSLTESALVSNGTGILIASDGGLIYSGTNDFVSLNPISFILD